MSLRRPKPSIKGVSAPEKEEEEEEEEEEYAHLLVLLREFKCPFQARIWNIRNLKTFISFHYPHVEVKLLSQRRPSINISLAVEIYEIYEIFREIFVHLHGASTGVLTRP